MVLDPSPPPLEVAQYVPKTKVKDTVPRTKLREHLCLVYLNTSEHPCEVAEYVPKTKVKVFRAGASSGKVKLKIL